MPKKMKSCMYDNERCFNLEERQEEEKEVKAKDVFQGYAKQKDTKSKGTKKSVANTKNKPKKKSY
jgi:hypothetical protein